MEFESLADFSLIIIDWNGTIVNFRNTEFLPGALAGLQYLHKLSSSEMLLATNAQRSQVYHFFDSHVDQGINMREIFNTIVTADDVTYPKPAREMFAFCLSLYPSLKGEVLVIDDSVESLRTAKECGMKTMLFGGAPDDNTRLSFIDYVCSDWRQLMA